MALAIQTRSSLETLPLEILCHIVHFGPCESILALQKVSREFYQLCSSSLFVNALRNTIVNKDDIGKSIWWHNISVCQDSAVTLARYKVADSKLAQLACSLDETTSEEALLQSGFLSYAPQLFVSNHPLVESPSLARALFKVLQTQFDGDASSEDLNVFTFCLATILLSRPYVDRASSLYSFSDTWALSPAKGLLEWLERVSRIRRHHAHSRPLDLAKYLNHQPLFANLVVSFFSVGILGTRLDCPSLNCDCRKVRPPRAVDIPLRKSMCLPSPFSRGTSEISSCHLNAMASPSFIEDGEWVGYYFYEFAPYLVDDDTYLPMCNINFKTNGESKDGRIGLHASDGTDDGGPFELEGTLEVATGTLNMTMTHPGGGSHVFSGMMTPFGFAGQVEEYSGYFWLWKASWMR